MKEIAEKFQKFGVVPVVVLEDTKDALAEATHLNKAQANREINSRSAQKQQKSLSVSWQSSSRKCLWEQVPYLQQNR